MAPFLILAALLAVVAGVTLLFFSHRTDTNFSWSISSPMAAGFLGAGYLSGTAAAAATFHDRSWPRIRAAAYGLVVFATMVTIATLLHIDRFRMDSWEGWFWTVFYVLFVPLALALVLLQERRNALTRTRDGPLTPTSLRMAMAVNAALTGVAAVMLWFAPTSTAGRWPWPLTPLTARMSAAIFGGACISSLMAALFTRVREVSLVTFNLGVLGCLTLLAMVLHRSDVTFERPLSWVLVVWAVLLTGLVLPQGCRWQLPNRNEP